MRRLVGLGLVLVLGVYAEAQRGGPPRRVENPQTIQLAGGARVEFREFEAPALGEAGQYSVFLPPSYQSASGRKFPVIYFLHGTFNDHTSWTVERYGNIPARIETMMLERKLPETILVFPYGANSFYTDYLDGSRHYERFVVEDLTREVESRYRADARRESRAIGGVSMGGYGSLKIAFKHPDLYASAAAASPIVLLGDDPSRHLAGADPRTQGFFSELFKPIFGIPFDPAHWKENSLEDLASSADLKGLHVYFSYGTDDRYNDRFPMEAGVRRLDKILTDRGIAHTFKCYEGEPHGWELVVSHLDEILAFLTQTFY